MTLKELAERIGTTAQTVQRLETANMTVSTDWLEKIARALDVEPADLIGGARARQIPLIGRVGERGHVHRLMGDQPQLVHFEVPAEDPVAARLDVSVGYFEAGTILIANRLRPADWANAHGLDCFVGLSSEATLLRRVIRGTDGSWTLVPLDNGTDVQYDQTLVWIARVIVAVRYL